MKNDKQLETIKVNLEINNPSRHGILTGIIECRTLLTTIMGVIIKPMRR